MVEVAKIIGLSFLIGTTTKQNKYNIKIMIK